MARTAKTKTKPSLANLTPPPRKKRPESLTSREQEILELMWAGFKNKEIGQRLKISVKTVEAHRANMMKKMRVSNTAQLLKTAIQDGTIKIRYPGLFMSAVARRSRPKLAAVSRKYGREGRTGSPSRRPNEKSPAGQEDRTT